MLASQPLQVSLSNQRTKPGSPGNFPVQWLLHAAGRGVPSQIGDLFGKLLRTVQILHHQPAILTGGFYGYVAHPEHSLPNGLDHAHVLHFWKLDQACGFRHHAGLIAQLFPSDGELDGLPLDVAFDGPDQKQKAYEREPRDVIFIRQVFVVDKHGGRNHKQRDRVAGFDEFHAGADNGVGHMRVVDCTALVGGGLITRRRMPSCPTGDN